MSIADTAKSQVRYVKETTWGATPASALKNLRFTGESLKFRIDTTKSNEIRSDRNITDNLAVGAGAEGGINFELSGGSIDDLLEGAMQSVWAADHIQNGVTPISFTIEKEFSDVVQFVSYTGMRVGDFNLEFAAGAIVTGNMSFMGKASAIGVVTVGTGAHVAAPTKDVMNAVSNVLSIQEGIPLAALTAKMSKLSLSIKNNPRGQNAIGTLGNIGIGTGRCDVSGTLSAYFENATLYNKFLANTATGLSWTAQDAAGNAYDFVIPKLKFSDGTIVAGGADADVMADFSFQAVLDPVLGYTIGVDRVVI